VYDRPVRPAVVVVSALDGLASCFLWFCSQSIPRPGHEVVDQMGFGVEDDIDEPTAQRRLLGSIASPRLLADYAVF